jgi:hypothetical protein
MLYQIIEFIESNVTRFVIITDQKQQNLTRFAGKGLRF